MRERPQEERLGLGVSREHVDRSRSRRTRRGSGRPTGRPRACRRRSPRSRAARSRRRRPGTPSRVCGSEPCVITTAGNGPRPAGSVSVAAIAPTRTSSCRCATRWYVVVSPLARPGERVRPDRERAVARGLSENAADGGQRAVQTVDVARRQLDEPGREALGLHDRGAVRPSASGRGRAPAGRASVPGLQAEGAAERALPDRPGEHAGRLPAVEAHRRGAARERELKPAAGGARPHDLAAGVPRAERDRHAASRTGRPRCATGSAEAGRRNEPTQVARGGVAGAGTRSRSEDRHASFNVVLAQSPGDARRPLELAARPARSRSGACAGGTSRARGSCSRARSPAAARAALRRRR